MKRSTLDLLCCPACQGELFIHDKDSDSLVINGTLFCPQCKRKFPLRDGIVSFINIEELEGLNRRFARFYERFSRYEAIFDMLSFFAMGGERKARQEVLKRLKHNNGRLLEVSIGSGNNLPYLFESANLGEVYGLDISAAQLTRCRRLANTKNWQIDLFLGMAEALPFKPELFDNVLHIGGINFFSDKKKAISEMIRVARRGGKIVIADESERVAQFVARFLRLSRSNQGRRVDTSVPVHLVPDTMEEIQVDGIWKRHGQCHGYCLEFRKPS